MPQRRGDARELESALRRRVSGEVRFDNGSRALYSTDASNYRQVPIGIVVPRDADDVMAAVAVCREQAAPVLCRGGGTSLAGQCCNRAVVLDFSRYMAGILEIDPERRLARVQPGVILDDLRTAAEKHHLTFGPDPASHGRCTIGGMVGNNSCGVHSVMAGKTDDNIEELAILTYDGVRLRVGETSEPDLERIIARGDRQGEIYAALKAIRDQYSGLVRQRFPDIPRRVSGYNLNFLLPEKGFHVARALVGSEGTCVTTLEVTCRLVASPPARVLAVIGCRDVYQCADLVPDVLSHRPIGLEGMDNLLVESTRRRGMNPAGVALLPEGGGWLLAEFGGETLGEAESAARRLTDALARSAASAPNVLLFPDRKQARKLWEVRESALGAVSHIPGEPASWEGWEDAAVSPEKLGFYLRELRKLADSYRYRCVMYGHFGDGCVHNRLSFDLQSAEGITKFRRFIEEAADLVVACGGSLSGEHGDGQARAELLPKMFGPELIEAFERFKAIWDGQWKMNPGKLVRPNPLDRDLRLGTEYKPWQPATHFRFPDDGSLAEASLRCVGVGKCREYQGGVMCPSFRATREEKHSTRGRAHLLWEMTKGELIVGGWRDPDVRSSLDLCLSCKGCKSDCPVGVDIATYKAEFLSHHYRGRLRPLNHYAFGHIDRWAAAASRAASFFNFLTRTPGPREIAKVAAGISPKRNIPALAGESFRRWFERRRRNRPAKRQAAPLVLWPDTFNNYFHPETSIRALEVLEAAGYEVRLPRGRVCCGRPLYDFGMIERAKRLLLRTIDMLDEEIAEAVPIVVLEPSCASVFRDELLNLLPDNAAARRLSAQVFLFSELLEKKAPRFSLPTMNRRAVLHGHCHQKSIMKMDDEEAVLRRLGLDFHSPAPGCCGMAGAFGFERRNYDISIRIGELELLPAIRNTPADCLIIADGFSCREQIAQCTGRKPLHLAEVIHLAMKKAGASHEEGK
jgi:FAD/FMN-containing dehydrogenase/Fe-S oxidoreductase